MQHTQLIQYFGCFSVAVATYERELQIWQHYGSVSNSTDATSMLRSRWWAVVVNTVAKHQQRDRG